jgi:hypothetical protein
MDHPNPYILQLSDDERERYAAIIRTLAERPYQAENITEHVITDLHVFTHADEPQASVARRLIALLRDDQSIQRLVATLPERSMSYPAARLLGWFGSRAQHAVPALIEAIGWGPTIGVGAAATAVVQIGGDPTPLLDGLYRALHESNDDAFPQLLGVAEERELQTDARFIQLLDSAAHTTNPTIRERAVAAIGDLPTDMRRYLSGTTTHRINDND